MRLIYSSLYTTINMEEFLKQKIDKEWLAVKKERQRFFKLFQRSKVFDYDKYVQAVNLLVNLNLHLYQGYVGLIPQQLFDEIIDNYIYLIGNLTQKLKFNKTQKVQTVNKLSTGMCTICFQNIRATNIQYTYNSIRQQEGILGSIKRELRVQNKPLFTQDEDIHFFRELKKLINQKQQINQFQIYEAEGFIAKITQTISQMKDLEQLSNEKQLQQHKVFYDLQLKDQLKKQLSERFLMRLPPWIQKMIETFQKMFRNKKKANQRQMQSQTMEWQPQQLLEKRQKCSQLSKKLNREIKNNEELTTTIQRLNSQIKINETTYTQLVKNHKISKRENNSISYSSSFLKKNSIFSEPDQIKNDKSVLENEDDLERIKVAQRKIIPKRLKKRKGFLPSLQSRKDSQQPSVSVIKSIERNSNQDKENYDSSLRQNQQILEQTCQLSSKNINHLKIIKNNQTIDKRKDRISIMVQKKQMNQEQRQQYLNKVKLVSQKYSQSLSSKFQKIKSRFSLFQQNPNCFSKNNNLDLIPQSQQYLGQNMINSSLPHKKLKKNLKKKGFRKSNATQVSVCQDNLDHQDCSVQTESFTIEQVQQTYNTMKNKNLLLQGLTFQHFSQIIQVVLAQPKKRQSIKVEKQLELPNIQQNNDQNRFSFQIQNEDQFLSTLRQKYGQISQLFFSDKDLQIFKDMKTALKYEQSFCQNYHKANFVVLTQDQEFYARSIYRMLQLVKNHEKQSYKRICAFIRYPYQVIMNKFQIINITNDMSQNCFMSYFQRILWIHRKCNKKKSQPVCHHIEKLSEKMQIAIGSKIRVNKTL